MEACKCACVRRGDADSGLGGESGAQCVAQKRAAALEREGGGGGDGANAGGRGRFWADSPPAISVRHRGGDASQRVLHAQRAFSMKRQPNLSPI